MNIFESIHIQGFRRLVDVPLTLRPLNVLIGANGCGKSSFLDVFSLLAASAAGEMKTRMKDMGGVDSNLSLLAESDVEKSSLMRFELERGVTDFAPLHYSIALRPSGTSYEIPAESLTQHNDKSRPKPMAHLQSAHGRIQYFDTNAKKLVKPTWDFDDSESALSQAGKMYLEPERFRATLASSTYYHALDVGPRAPVRLPQQMREAFLPGKDGEDLVTCLYWMREARPDRFEVIEDTLRLAFRGFERLNFPPVASGMLALTWKDREYSKPFYLHQLSEGTLRFLWLVTLLYSPGLTEVTLLDEPEVSLHPELLSILADCLREASTRTQLIVATHADRLVRFLKPENVVAFDLSEGVTTATRAEDLDLDAWLKEYTLDQVWGLGPLGGRS
jgi:predicted ATPase